MDFFISYRYEDRHLAGRVARLLEASGQKCFLAHDNMTISLDFEDEIRRQIDQSTVLVAVVTPNFAESIYANQEVGIAIGKAKPIIQLWFPAVDKSKLGFLHSLNAIQTTEEGLSTVVSKILDATGKQIRDNFVRPAGFVEAGKIVDSMLDVRKEPYYRVYVRPQGLYHMFQVSKENFDWLSSNRPSLFQYMTIRPNRNGVTFSHTGPYFGEVSTSGELCYGEAVARIDGVTIGRPIVILSQLIEYASRFYEKFPWNRNQQGTVAVIELKLGHVHGHELQTEGSFRSLWKGRCEKQDIVIDKPVALEALSTPKSTLESTVIDLFLDFGISVSDKEAGQYVESILGKPRVEASQSA